MTDATERSDRLRLAASACDDMADLAARFAVEHRSRGEFVSHQRFTAIARLYRVQAMKYRADIGVVTDRVDDMDDRLAV